MRDVTKTKPSHHRPREAANSPQRPPAVNAPTTPEGNLLAAEVNASSLAAPAKARLIQEIIEYEGSHGKCTQTFSKKVRKQLRA